MCMMQEKQGWVLLNRTGYLHAGATGQRCSSERLEGLSKVA